MPIPLIGDDNYRDFIGDGKFVEHDGIMRPLTARPCLTPPGRIVGAPLVVPEQLIPREQWDYLIAEMDSNNSWLETIVRANVPCQNQGGLGYCHAYSTTEAAQVAQALQGEPCPPLAATSVGGPITDWQNVGGDIADDWAQIRDYGVCELSYLPDGVILPPPDPRENPSAIRLLLNPNAYKPGWQANALNHREFAGLDLRLTELSFDAVATMCFRCRPVVVGFGWWGHAITGGYRVMKLGKGQYALRYRNNWGASYGDNGFLDLHGSKAVPDLGAIANLGMTPLST